jgi:hypothetical protein
LALLQLLSTMNETRSATAWGNSALSTSACTRRVGTGLVSVEAAVPAVNCCKAAAPLPAPLPVPVPVFASPAAPRSWSLPPLASAGAAANTVAGETDCVEAGCATFCGRSGCAGTGAAAVAACVDCKAAAVAPVASEPSASARLRAASLDGEPAAAWGEDPGDAEGLFGLSLPPAALVRAARAAAAILAASAGSAALDAAGGCEALLSDGVGGITFSSGEPDACAAVRAALETELAAAALDADILGSTLSAGSDEDPGSPCETSFGLSASPSAVASALIEFMGAAL